jgi:hypothetical protein
MQRPIYRLSNIPGHSDLNNGSEFVAKAVQEWITAIGAKTAYIEPAQGKRLPAPPAPAGPASRHRPRVLDSTQRWRPITYSWVNSP